jgi:hypothetical protein
MENSNARQYIFFEIVAGMRAERHIQRDIYAKKDICGDICIDICGETIRR